MNTKISSVTGHKDIPSEKADFITEQATAHHTTRSYEGYTHFISGFAAGVDLIFADFIAELKAQYPISLEAAILYQGRMKIPDKDFGRLIKFCDVVKVHSDSYSKDCYMKRNRYMAEQSEIVLMLGMADRPVEQLRR